MNTKTCSLPECDNKHEAKGYCSKHYQQHKASLKPPKHTRVCEFCGASFGTNYSAQTCCGSAECKRIRANRYTREYIQANGSSRRYYWPRECGICGKRYQATHKTGKHCPDCKGEAMVAARFPENLPIYKAIRAGTPRDVLDAILGRCTVTADGCWEWQGTRNSAGYGHVSTGRVEGRAYELVHRVTYEYATGVEPTGMTVHHKCANATCCNPEHLQLASHQENIAEMQARLTYEAQIAELRKALAKHEPNHPLLR